MTVHVEHKAKEKAKGFASINPSSQRIIFVASSLDGMDPVDESVAHCI